jgi:hypothetical protein
VVHHLTDNIDCGRQVIFGNECFYGLFENQIDVLQTGCQKKDTNLLFKAELNNLAIQFCNEIPQ